MRIGSRWSTIVVGAAVAVLAQAAPGLASGLHWYQGGTPTVTVSGSTVEATGQVAGAGQFINAWMTIDYNFSSLCYNPGNDAGPVPGQSGSGVVVNSPSQTIQAIHGNASFDLVYTVRQSASCPSRGWTSVVTIDVTSVTVHVTSSNGGSLTYVDNDV